MGSHLSQKYKIKPPLSQKYNKNPHSTKSDFKKLETDTNCSPKNSILQDSHLKHTPILKGGFKMDLIDILKEVFCYVLKELLKHLICKYVDKKTNKKDR